MMVQMTTAFASPMRSVVKCADDRRKSSCETTTALLSAASCETVWSLRNAAQWDNPARLCCSLSRAPIAFTTKFRTYALLPRRNIQQYKSNITESKTLNGENQTTWVRYCAIASMNDQQSVPGCHTFQIKENYHWVPSASFLRTVSNRESDDDLMWVWRPSLRNRFVCTNCKFDVMHWGSPMTILNTHTSTLNWIELKNVYLENQNTNIKKI